MLNMSPHDSPLRGLLWLLSCSDSEPWQISVPWPSSLSFSPATLPTPCLSLDSTGTLLPQLSHFTMSSAWNLLTSGNCVVYYPECLLKCHSNVCSSTLHSPHYFPVSFSIDLLVC